MPPRRSTRRKSHSKNEKEIPAKKSAVIEEGEGEGERGGRDVFDGDETVLKMVEKNLSRTTRMFRNGDAQNGGLSLLRYYDGNAEDDQSKPLKIAVKTRDQYAHVVSQSRVDVGKAKNDNAKAQKQEKEGVIEEVSEEELKEGERKFNGLDGNTTQILEKQQRERVEKRQAEERKRKRGAETTSNQMQMILAEEQQQQRHRQSSSALTLPSASTSSRFNTMDKSLMLIEKRRRLEESMQPDWHAPWKLMRVISGHSGWVRAIAFDPSNEWFATGGTDRTIKVWDLASGTLKITLTGHIAAVRGIAISERSPYMFTVAEDNTVKCWDLEQNKIIRNYHGHLSGVYCVDLHPTLDVLATGGRDSSVRIWDIRTKTNIFTLSGHKDSVHAVSAQANEPQIISGSQDSTVRLWDLAAGKNRTTLTNHKKGVRSLFVHPTESTFCSASADNIKKWKCPEGRFMHNFSGHNAIVNTVCINNDNVMASGGDDGTMHLWDWKSGYNFQKLTSVPQPGSLDSEAGILAAKFDISGSRLVTGEVDKSIKVWCEDERATPETHPVVWRPDAVPKRY